MTRPSPRRRSGYALHNDANLRALIDKLRDVDGLTWVVVAKRAKVALGTAWRIYHRTGTAGGPSRRYLTLEDDR